MPIPLIPIGIALAELFGPKLVQLVAGDTAGDVAQKVVNAATGAAGTSDPQAALEKIKANAAVKVKFIEKALVIEQEETTRLLAFFDVIKTDNSSDDPYVRRFRPTIGYAIVFTFCAISVFSFAVIWTFTAEQMKWIVELYGRFVPMVMVGLSVVGVYVRSRSTHDKVLAAGKTPAQGILASIGAAIRK